MRITKILGNLHKIYQDSQTEDTIKFTEIIVSKNREINVLETRVTKLEQLLKFAQIKIEALEAVIEPTSSGEP